MKNIGIDVRDTDQLVGTLSGTYSSVFIAGPVLTHELLTAAQVSEVVKLANREHSALHAQCSASAKSSPRRCSSSASFRAALASGPKANDSLPSAI